MQLKWNKQSIKIYKIIFNKIKTLFDLSLKTRLILTPFIMDSSTMFWSFLCNTTKRKTTLFFTNKFILHLFWRLGSLEVVFFFSSLENNFFSSIMSDRSLFGSICLDDLHSPRYMNVMSSCSSDVFSPFETLI